MMNKDIVQIGSPVLRQKCSIIPTITPNILDLSVRMKELLRQGGIGLAAPQVGVPIRLITIMIPIDDKSTSRLIINGEQQDLSEIMPLDFINPVIRPYGNIISYHEGCLSVKHIYADILRPECVEAKLTLLDGRTLHIDCNGLLARCLQHECDHLDGRLFLDLAQEKDLAKIKHRLAVYHPESIGYSPTFE